MPSKKPIKTAKKPGKATPGKAGHRAAAPKKGARPLLKHTPIATSKVTVKPNKPVPKPAAAKPAPAKPAAVKTVRAKPVPVKPAAVKPAAVKPAAVKPAVVKPAPAAPEPKSHDAIEINDKHAPLKFDTRPLVMPTRPAQNDDDADADPSVPASLLAGPRNVKPYIARRGEQYMNKEQLDHFARILQNWKRDLMVEVDRTVLHMKDEAANFPDPNDRATQEEEFSLELRTRDRERKLIRKIDEALKRIEDGSYGYCLETGEEIGIKRLEARPVATLSVEAQERRERREKQYGDRDDRYR
jgi:DnaK suppressor protein